MGVVQLREPVMSERLRAVHGALQRLEQADLHYAFARLAPYPIEQLLDFSALGQVTAGKAHRLGLGAKFQQPARIGILVDAVEARSPASLQLKGHDLVGQQHELLDELM